CGWQCSEAARERVTGMIVIVAHRYDNVAQHLGSHWASYGASLLTSTDLSSKGWRYELGRAHTASTAVISGQIVAREDIHGVLILIPHFFAQELVEIVPRDRVYVGSGMTAFLPAWLCELSCPVLNRPTPTC